MADNRQVYPLGLGMDQAAAAEEPAADPASAAPIFGHRLGCALHVVHLAVTAGMTNPCFVGLLGVGISHEPRVHLVALLGCLVQHISRSKTCHATFFHFQNLIAKHFPEGTFGRHKFIKPAETRWMVVWGGAVLLSQRVFGADGGATSEQGHHFKGLIQLAKATLQPVKVSLRDAFVCQILVKVVPNTSAVSKTN